MNQIIRIKDLKDQLQSWVVVDKIENKYNATILTYQVELVGNRSVTTQIYVDGCYTGNNGRTYYRNVVSTGNKDRYVKAEFIHIKLES
jgi:hypothetical protein